MLERVDFSGVFIGVITSIIKQQLQLLSLANRNHKMIVLLLLLFSILHRKHLGSFYNIQTSVSHLLAIHECSVICILKKITKGILMFHCVWRRMYI